MVGSREGREEGRTGGRIDQEAGSGREEMAPREKKIERNVKRAGHRRRKIQKVKMDIEENEDVRKDVKKKRKTKKKKEKRLREQDTKSAVKEERQKIKRGNRKGKINGVDGKHT